jgi:hypothetical protein
LKNQKKNKSIPQFVVVNRTSIFQLFGEKEEENNLNNNVKPGTAE